MKDHPLTEQCKVNQGWSKSCLWGIFVAFRLHGWIQSIVDLLSTKQGQAHITNGFREQVRDEKIATSLKIFCNYKYILFSKDKFTTQRLLTLSDPYMSIKEQITVIAEWPNKKATLGRFSSTKLESGIVSKSMYSFVFMVGEYAAVLFSNRSYKAIPERAAINKDPTRNRNPRAIPTGRRGKQQQRDIFIFFNICKKIVQANFIVLSGYN